MIWSGDMTAEEFLKLLQDTDPYGTKLDFWGRSPLHYQCMQPNNAENIKLCLSHVKHKYIKDKSRKTACDYAKESGYGDDILDLLSGITTECDTLE